MRHTFTQSSTPLWSTKSHLPECASFPVQRQLKSKNIPQTLFPGWRSSFRGVRLDLPRSPCAPHEQQHLSSYGAAVTRLSPPVSPRTRGEQHPPGLYSRGGVRIPSYAKEREIRTNSTPSRIRDARACRGANIGQPRGVAPTHVQNSPVFSLPRLSLRGAPQGRRGNPLGISDNPGFCFTRCPLALRLPRCHCEECR